MREARRIQKPVKGGRARLSAGVIKSIDRELDKAAARFNVSKSFAASVALADYFRVQDQEQFQERPRLRAVAGGRR